MSKGTYCERCLGPIGPGKCSYIRDECVQDFELMVQGEPETVAPETVAEFQVHCTPPAVAEQCLRAVLDGWERLRRVRPGTLRSMEPIRVLDICAGYGVWSQVLRRLAEELGFEVHITGLEIREACRPHLMRHCDHVIIGDAARILGFPGSTGHIEPPWDLIMGNPPFSMDDERAPERKSGQKSRLRAFEVLVVSGRELLADRDSRLALYLPTDWWRTSNGCAALIAGDGDGNSYWPVAQYDLAQRAQHGLEGGTDTRVYSCFVWDHPANPNTPEWTTRCLPTLEAGELKFDVLPGTEHDRQRRPSHHGDAALGLRAGL